MAPSLNHHGARIVSDRSLIEHEVVGGEGIRIDAMQGDRLAGTERDHRVTVGGGGHDRKVAEACNAGKADQVDLVGRGIEIVDGVVADWLSEDEEIIPASAGQRVVARKGKDWRALA